MLGHWYNLLLAGVPASAAAVGAPGGRKNRYVVYVDGARVVGTYAQIQATLRALAEQQATQVIDKAKAPQKPVIVVKPGSDVDKPAPIVEPMRVQAQVQEFYADIYEQAISALMAQKLALMARDMDDEEAMLLL